MADKLRKASSTGVAAVATASAPRAVGGTALSVSAGGLTNWASTSVDFTTYKLVDGVITNKTDWTGKADLDNDIITDLEVTNGTDVGNAQDDFIVCIETSAWVNDLVSTLLTVFDPAGTLKSGGISSSAIAASATSTAKLVDLAVTIPKLDVSARQQTLDINGTTELVFSAATTQPSAQAGKTIIWFAPTT